MINFKISNGVLQKIAVEGGVGHQPVSGVIKIPHGVTEIVADVLDNSVVGEGYKGHDFFHFKGVVIPKSVTKISPNAFKSININKEVIIEKLPYKVDLDSENMILYFEDETQKHLAEPLKNKSHFGGIIPLLFSLSEQNDTIPEWFFGKLSVLKLTRNDDAIIEFNSNILSISITHFNHVISSIIIDNPFYGRRINKEENNDDTYIFNLKTDTFDEMRVRELFD